jgi:homoserine dehydrogenase
LGHGTVGSALVRLIDQQHDTISTRNGVDLVVSKIAVRDISKHHGLTSARILTDDPWSIVRDPEIDLVVEVMGGVESTLPLVLTALEHGKPVITANKELLAAHGATLFAAAETAGVDLLFEASVCGGIPVVRPMRESLRGEPIRRVLGIMNGTTNYILTKMSEDGAAYHDALREAQELGFAEADPSADVDGHDAAAKLSILASTAFGMTISAADVHREGITALDPGDISIARRLGYEVKLVGIAEQGDDGSVLARVHLVMVPQGHPLAAVRGSYNAVVIDGQYSGTLMFYGRGAGGEPTASAVLGDVIDASLNLLRSTCAGMGRLQPAHLESMSSSSGEYLVPLEVADEPGVLHVVSGVFARHGVSIAAAEQDRVGSVARLVFLTHRADEDSVQACLTELRMLPIVGRVGGVLRVLGE